MKTVFVLSAIAASASLAAAGDVDPGIIFGSGNANGSFTLGSGGGVQLGLRAKLRHNSAGNPENTFNWDGGSTYTFDPADGNPPANRAMWNFEWSVNSDVNGTTGNDLNDFTYQLSMFKVNADGTNPADALSWDMINGADPRHGLAIYDHAIGDNGTLDGAGTVDIANYGTLIGENNVAQNSWNYGFFNSAGTGPLEGIDPSMAGTYIIRLMAFDGMGLVTSTEITVNVVPLPGAAWAGLGLLGTLAGVRAVRRR